MNNQEVFEFMWNQIQKLVCPYCGKAGGISFSEYPHERGAVQWECALCGRDEYN